MFSLALLSLESRTKSSITGKRIRLPTYIISFLNSVSVFDIILFTIWKVQSCLQQLVRLLQIPSCFATDIGKLPCLEEKSRIFPCKFLLREEHTWKLSLFCVPRSKMSLSCSKIEMSLSCQRPRRPLTVNRATTVARLRLSAHVGEYKNAFVLLHVYPSPRTLISPSELPC